MKDYSSKILKFVISRGYRVRTIFWRSRGMYEIQQQQIRKLRHEGYGYTRIAKSLNLSVNTVKSYCRRHKLGGNKVLLSHSVEVDCRNCQKSISQLPGRKKRVFCSDTCRINWWNSHPEMVKRKALYSYTCACCGKSFVSYGNRNRKYCSHTCYVSARFRRQQL